MLVGFVDHHWAPAAVDFTGLAFEPRKLQHLVVAEILLEVLAVGEVVEELEGGLARVEDVLLEAVVEKLFPKVVRARAATLDLDEIGRGENRPEQSKIEDVGA